MFKQNSFSRSLANDKKMGAYYTDLGHCERIGHLFDFSAEEICVLEPSIGDASAVISVTKANNPNIKLFGVELNRNTYDEVNARGIVDYLLNEDFLHGVKISHGSFSFCFANPPYGLIQDENRRYETAFVDKLSSYLMTDGLLALVIPYYVLVDENFLRTFFKYFQPVAQYRFDDDVYSSFKQIVVIGKKRNGLGYMRDSFIKYQNDICELENLPYLPGMDDAISKFIVLPSNEKNVEYFTSVSFNSMQAAEYLKASPLYRVMYERGSVPQFLVTKLGKPPVPLKKDLLYLCAISGGGQGMVGEDEKYDVHLQRGVVKVSTSTEYAEDGTEMMEKSYSKVYLNIIENDGTITTLE